MNATLDAIFQGETVTPIKFQLWHIDKNPMISHKYLKRMSKVNVIYTRATTESNTSKTVSRKATHQMKYDNMKAAETKIEPRHEWTLQ